MHLFRWIAQHEDVLVRDDALDAVQIDAPGAQNYVPHWGQFSTVKERRTYLKGEIDE